MSPTPPWAGWGLLTIIAGLMAFASARARRSGELKWPDLAKGIGGALMLLAAEALALHLVRHMTGVQAGWVEGRALLARFPAFEVAMALAAS